MICVREIISRLDFMLWTGLVLGSQEFVPSPNVSEMLCPNCWMDFAVVLTTCQHQYLSLDRLRELNSPSGESGQ